MGYRFDAASFDRMLAELATQFDCYAPVRFSGKGRFSDTDLIRYAKISSLADIVTDRKSTYSPKEMVFPITQTVFHFVNGMYTVPDIPDRGIIIFLRPCDINGIERIDTIFLANGNTADPYYQRLREKVKYFMIECAESFENCFCVSMQSNTTENYAAAFRFGEEVLAECRDEAFASLFDAHGAPAEYDVRFITENAVRVTPPAVETMPRELFEDPMWEEYTARCIACGRCNTTCVTCSCFTTKDVFYDENAAAGERRRTWASCHVDGFTDMAGGHSFRKKNAQRMRFKTFHKVYDFRKRFGRNMCVGCGRCDDNCPEYISFSTAVNRLSERLQNGGSCGN